MSCLNSEKNVLSIHSQLIKIPKLNLKKNLSENYA